MLSRVADSVYWLNRYIERAENTARFIDVNLQLSLDLSGPLSEQWEPLVITSGDRAAFKERYGEPHQKNVIQFLTSDLENPNSIMSCLTVARENARSVREIISSEMWEHVNKFYLLVKDAIDNNVPLSEPYQFYGEIKRSAHLFAGIMEATMSHGEGWNFGRMGRFLERADKTSRILDVKYFILLPNAKDVGTPFENIQWAAVLKSASAFEMYRNIPEASLWIIPNAGHCPYFSKRVPFTRTTLGFLDGTWRCVDVGFSDRTHPWGARDDRPEELTVEDLAF